jgi:RNA polymerase sigma-70 factor (ECF subfamily)
VLAAGQRSSPAAADALATLCQTYWYPLYAFARRRGCAPEDAADLTQGFFADLLDKDFLRTADQQRGRFRSFLLTVFKRFLSHEQQRQQTQKRGGGRQQFSIDAAVGEARYQYEPTDEWTAERLYDRRWALTLLDDVMARLESEYQDKGKGELFARCKIYLTAGTHAPPQAEVAEKLNMTPVAVRVAVHRLRHRYKEMLQEAVAQTIGPEESITDEITRLRLSVRGNKT